MQNKKSPTHMSRAMIKLFGLVNQICQPSILSFNLRLSILCSLFCLNIPVYIRYEGSNLVESLPHRLSIQNLSLSYPGHQQALAIGNVPVLIRKIPFVSFSCSPRITHCIKVNGNICICIYRVC